MTTTLERHSSSVWMMISAASFPKGLCHCVACPPPPAAALLCHLMPATPWSHLFTSQGREFSSRHQCLLHEGAGKCFGWADIFQVMLLTIGGRCMRCQQQLKSFLPPHVYSKPFDSLLAASISGKSMMPVGHQVLAASPESQHTAIGTDSNHTAALHGHPVFQ